MTIPQRRVLFIKYDSKDAPSATQLVCLHEKVAASEGGAKEEQNNKKGALTGAKESQKALRKQCTTIASDGGPSSPRGTYRI